MADPRTRAVKQALQTSEEIRRLFGRIGTRQYPRGLVLAAYRTALAAMRGSTDNNRLMDDALGTLRLAVIDAVMDVLNRGVDIGMHQAETELKLWGISAFGTAGNVDDAARIVSNILDNQIQAAWTMKRMGVEEAVLLGDAAHLGIINPTVITRETARWASMTVNDAYGSIVKQSLEKSGDAGQFDKQAVAAIDDKTTDCCLKVQRPDCTIGRQVQTDRRAAVRGRDGQARVPLVVPQCHGAGVGQ